MVETGSWGAILLMSSVGSLGWPMCWNPLGTSPRMLIGNGLLLPRT